MENQFDYFVVEVYSTSIRSLLLFNIKRNDIKTKITYKGRFPKKEHTVTLKYFNVCDYGSHNAARKAAEEYKNSLPNIENSLVYIKFNPVD